MGQDNPVETVHLEATPVTMDPIDIKKSEHRDEVSGSVVGLKVALTSYRNAMLYSLFFCFSAILWGYDMQVSGGLLAAPEFRAVFGYTQADGTTILPAQWQAAFNMIATVGGMGGSLLCGPISPYAGRRMTLAIACVISSGSIFLQFFAFTRGVLLAGKLINGIALGMFLVTACAYCSEACPVVLRGITIAMVNLFVVVGQLLGNCLIKAFGGRSDTFAYRIPFAFQWIFPAILLTGVWFCPESPYWYVQRGKHTEAKKSLERFQTGGSIDSWLNEIQETVRIEEESASSAGYLDCFRGTDLRRTLIVMAVWTINSFSGVNFVLSYSTYFFQSKSSQVDNLGSHLCLLIHFTNYSRWNTYLFIIQHGRWCDCSWCPRKHRLVVGHQYYRSQSSLPWHAHSHCDSLHHWHSRCCTGLQLLRCHGTVRIDYRLELLL